MITTVFIQQQNGRLSDEPSFNAWLGFKKKRYAIEFFDLHELTNAELPVAADTLVVGGVQAVELALEQIGVPVPLPLNLPECLSAHRGRKVWYSTWKEIRQRSPQDDSVQPPLFVKPRLLSKSFPGYVIYNSVGLIATGHLPDEMELEVSEFVEFVSEWRCFVHRHEIIGLSHYKGDCVRFPDPSVLHALVRDYQPHAPIAYALDVGITGGGETLLVEVNDAYALGCYGLRAVPRAAMLKDRWEELVVAAASSTRHVDWAVETAPPAENG